MWLCQKSGYAHIGFDWSGSWCMWTEAVRSLSLCLHSSSPKSWAVICNNKYQTCLFPQCLIIGGGPCGFRAAIELALLGAKVVVIEKRDTFSRNNVLHLWPYTIHDLRNLGAKKFYGKFCAGSIDHISRLYLLQLQYHAFDDTLHW